MLKSSFSSWIDGSTGVPNIGTKFHLLMVEISFNPKNPLNVFFRVAATEAPIVDSNYDKI